MSRILTVIAGGMGNQIQMTAAIRTLRERLNSTVDILSVGLPGNDNPHAEFDPILPGNVYQMDAREPLWGRYDGAVLLGFGATGDGATWRAHDLKVLNDPARQAVGYTYSEVDTSMNACRDLGIAEEDLIWHGQLNWNQEYNERFDVVLANGYYRKESGYWDVKGFPGFQSLARELQQRWPNLSVCSIGKNGGEYVRGTIDRTGLRLINSLALIAKAKFLICTDSMAFHAAGALGTKAYALFTATSVMKNADPRFHWNARIIRRTDLACRGMCQEQGHRWLRCDKAHECQMIGIGYIADIIADEQARGTSTTTNGWSPSL